MARMREANERLVVAAVHAQALTEEAERASHLKDEFLTAVSHDTDPLECHPWMGTDAGVEAIAP